MGLVEFEWTVTFGQVVSTTAILIAVGLVYWLGVARYSKVYSRVDALELRIADLRADLDRLLGAMKTEQL